MKIKFKFSGSASESSESSESSKSSKTKLEPGWLARLHEEYPHQEKDFLLTDWMPAIIMALIVILAFSGDSGEQRLNNVTSSISECEFYEGIVIHKENEPPHALYVVSNIGDYKVWVTESTYDSVEINDTYSGLVCNDDSFLYQFFGFLYENRPQIVDIR
jgi:hypothetical protein